MKENLERKFYSASEIAQMLGVTRQAVYIQIQKGAVPHKRFGDRVLIPKKFVDNLIAEK